MLWVVAGVLLSSCDGALGGSLVNQAVARVYWTVARLFLHGCNDVPGHHKNNAGWPLGCCGCSLGQQAAAMIFQVITSMLPGDC